MGPELHAFFSADYPSINSRSESFDPSQTYTYRVLRLASANLKSTQATRTMPRFGDVALKRFCALSRLEGADVACSTPPRQPASTTKRTAASSPSPKTSSLAST